MAVIRKLLRQRRGDAAVGFILTTAMLVLVFAVLVSSLIFVMQYYNASYACRRIVRDIEMAGRYNAIQVRSTLNTLTGDSLTGTSIRVEAAFLSGSRIQLRQPFSVTLTARYRIAILRFGDRPVYLTLPIQVKVAGMSEVLWR